MNRVLSGRPVGTALERGLIFAFVLVLNSLLLIRENGWLTALILVATVPVILYLLLFDKKLLTYLTVFFIPLSFSGGLVGQSVISFPSEALCALLAGAVIFRAFFKTE